MRNRKEANLSLLVLGVALAVVGLTACGGGARQADIRYGLQFDPGALHLELDVAKTVTRVVTLRNLTTKELVYSLVPPPDSFEEGPVLFVDVDVHTVEDSVGPGASHDLELDISCPVVPGEFQYLLPVEWDSGRAELVVSATCVDAPIETIVAEDTRILDPETRSAITSYDPQTGTILFDTVTSFVADLEPGHVLVSEPAAAIPEGFLRRVTEVSLSAAGATILTEEAGLDDVFDQFEMNEELETEFSLENLTFLHEDVGLTAEVSEIGGSAASLRFNFDRVLFDRDGDSRTTDDRLTVNGSVAVNLKPELKARMTIQWRMVCIGFKIWGKCRGIKTKIPVGLSAYYFSGVTLSQSSDLTVEGAVRFQDEWRIPIAEHHFTPSVFFVGPVPVVVTHKAVFFIDADLNLYAELVYEYKQTSSLRAGVEYDGRLKLVGDVKRSSSQHFDFDGNLDAGLMAGGRWESKLYGVIGPFAEVRAGLRLGVTARAGNETEFTWRLHSCLYGDVGLAGSIRIFTLKIGPSTKPILRQCSLLREGFTIISGEITGRATSTASGEPLANATVRVGTREVRTNLDGTFRAVLPPGWYLVEVGAADHAVMTVGPMAVRKGEATDVGEIGLIPLLRADERWNIVLEWNRWFPEGTGVGTAPELDLDSRFGSDPTVDVYVSPFDPGSLVEFPYVQLINDAQGGPLPQDRREEMEVAFLYPTSQYTFAVSDAGWGPENGFCGLISSEARVSVFRGGDLVATFPLPETSPVECPNYWSVFTIDPATGEIYPLGLLTQNYSLY